ncbi:MAG: ATP-binding protein [Acidimicrobiia bacterium]
MADAKVRPRQGGGDPRGRPARPRHPARPVRRRLAPHLGFRPDLPDVPTLFRVLLRAGRGEERLLVVVDEFPELLPTTGAGIRRLLSSLRAVLEDESAASTVKLIVCGSSIAQMRALLTARNPLHGRFTRLVVEPVGFGDAGAFFPGTSPVELVERFSVSGGTPRYLSEMAGSTLRDRVVGRVLDRNGPLWDEARSVLANELRQPATYFSILEQLASGGKAVDEIARGARVDNGVVSRYLGTLGELGLVARRLPIGAAPGARSGQWWLADPFLRFWFRFVFPYHADLASGLPPDELWRRVVAPAFADHVSPTFEDLCRRWVRIMVTDGPTRVGAWWGHALHGRRRSGERSSEEIDVVGVRGRRVLVAGECRWRNRPSGPGMLSDLLRYKLPALAQAGLTPASDVRIVMFSRAGFSSAAHRAAAAREGAVELVDAARVVSDLARLGQSDAYHCCGRQ